MLFYCLDVADPATFLAPNSVLGTVFSFFPNFFFQNNTAPLPSVLKGY